MLALHVLARQRVDQSAAMRARMCTTHQKSPAIDPYGIRARARGEGAEFELQACPASIAASCTFIPPGANEFPAMMTDGCSIRTLAELLKPEERDSEEDEVCAWP